MAKQEPIEESKYRAQLAMSPEANASVIAETFAPRVYGKIDGQTYYEQLDKVTKRGDSLHESERMLLSHAHALDVLFVNLSRCSALNVGEYLDATDTYMKLALRAQNQCRMTLETLATIKNPPTVFAKQANIAHGHQQVNNGDPVPVAHAGKQNKPTELLEAPRGKPEWMDAGTQGTTGRIDSRVEAVAEIDGATHEGRQGKGKP